MKKVRKRSIRKRSSSLKSIQREATVAEVEAEIKAISKQVREYASVSSLSMFLKEIDSIVAPIRAISNSVKLANVFATNVKDFAPRVDFSFLDWHKQYVVALQDMIDSIGIKHIQKSMAGSYLIYPINNPIVNTYRDATTRLEFKEIQEEEVAGARNVLASEETVIDLGPIQVTHHRAIDMEVVLATVNELKQKFVAKDKSEEETKRKIAEIYDILIQKNKEIVKIVKIQFKEQDSQININNTFIPIEADTNQFELCKYLFRSKQNMSRKFLPIDLFDAIGESQANREEQKLYESYYAAAYRINKKIETMCGLKSFIIFKRTGIYVNPAYI